MPDGREIIQCYTLCSIQHAVRVYSMQYTVCSLQYAVYSIQTVEGARSSFRGSCHEELNTPLKQKLINFDVKESATRCEQIPPGRLQSIKR